MASPSPSDPTSRSTLHRRPIAASSNSSTTSSAGGPLLADVDPPPKPPRLLQVLAFAVIVFLACLQFLPATHFRHPHDPHRNWIPFNPNPTGANTRDAVIERIHVFSWADCLDLRMLAVLVNSTLSNARLAENVYFHIFVPEGIDEKLTFYKMKVLLPRSNIDIMGQKEVKEKLRTILPELEDVSTSLRELIPLIIPIINPSLTKFIYVSSDTMIKGNIEQLFGLDLGLYSISAAKDCSRRLGDYVNIDVVNAIQRTAAKSWVSDEAYDRNACTLDFDVLLLDAQKMDKELLEAILWWIKVLNLKDERSNKINAVVALALYNRVLNLPSVWKLGSVPSKLDNETNILRYDGPLVCLRDGRQHQGSDTSNIWQNYFDPKLDAILAH